jgi:hypothetical protein
MPMSIIGRGRFPFHFRGWHQLKRPIRVRAAARRAVMPGDEINGRGLDGLAAFTAQAAKQIFECHIALASHQQSHGIADRATPAMQAMQLNHALRPVRQPVRLAKKGRMHPAILHRNGKRTRAKLPPNPGLRLLGRSAKRRASVHWRNLLSDLNQVYVQIKHSVSNTHADILCKTHHIKLQRCVFWRNVLFKFMGYSPHHTIAKGETRVHSQRGR